MSRRSKRGQARASEVDLPEVYEGPAVLSELLARSGSPFGTGDVADRFREAQAAGRSRGDTVPALFRQEPHFASPEEARRLYSNLFGLWNRLLAGLSITEDPPEGTPANTPSAAGQGAAPPFPRRGAAMGDELSSEIVEAVWKHLDGLPEREQRRLRHRFESAQPDVVAWLDTTSLSDAAAIAAQDLAFEAWAMFDVAFGDRVRAVQFAALRELADEPPALEATQPALAAYVGEVLDLLGEEDESVGVAQRAHVERVVATISAALVDALEEE